MQQVITNIIFDLDGTLVDSKRDIAGAQLWVLHQLGVDSYQLEDIYPLIGKPLTETFATLLPPAMHHRIAEAAELYKTYYPPRALETTILFPNVRETLDALRTRGIRLATTTKLTPGTRRVLTHFGIDGYFDQIQGSDNIPFKPDPFIINKILEDQLWGRTETLMVGDTDNDIHAGKRAGIPTCGVTYGSLSKEQMQQLEPDFMIDSLPELLSHIR
ncbi:MAG: HAD-superfamily hydrolase, subfamily variant 3 [Bacteroidetes bacterium]|nr:HAD-superfamily hydrolase, subfamily variant 3 [Bacteroidota bacterium]